MPVSEQNLTAFNKEEDDDEVDELLLEAENENPSHEISSPYAAPHYPIEKNEHQRKKLKEIVELNSNYGDESVDKGENQQSISFSVSNRKISANESGQIIVTNEIQPDGGEPHLDDFNDVDILPQYQRVYISGEDTSGVSEMNVSNKYRPNVFLMYTYIPIPH